MRFFTYAPTAAPSCAARLGYWHGDVPLALPDHQPEPPGGLLGLLQAGGAAWPDAEALYLRHGRALPADGFRFLPPVPVPPKILCIGLNYREHTNESGFEQPAHPTVFSRFASSLTSHRQPIVRPRCSVQLDFEGELALFIGRRARHVGEAQALDHVAGYSVCNEASVRDYQFRSPQWTLGKNFDATASLGPSFVSADELPPAASGLQLRTRLNGVEVQGASTDQMIFGIPALIAQLSEVMTLEPGTVVVTGTPAGVGLGRQPPLWMKPGDRVEVEIEGIGCLVNAIAAEEDLLEARRHPAQAKEIQHAR